MAKPIDAHRRSPLFHRRPIAGEDGAIRIAERPFLGKFILRVDPKLAADLLLGVVGLGLPTTALASATAGDTSLLWLGPDEWMLITAPESAGEILANVRNVLRGIHHQLVDVSDYYTAIEIAGPKAREALMKLTTLDLHPRALKQGMVAGSVFGHCNPWLWQKQDDSAEGGPVFHLFIRWSMADYLWCLLANAGREWGVPQEVPVRGEKLTVD